jgi:hypothetical protein
VRGTAQVPPTGIQAQSSASGSSRDGLLAAGVIVGTLFLGETPPILLLSANGNPGINMHTIAEEQNAALRTKNYQGLFENSLVTGKLTNFTKEEI